MIYCKQPNAYGAEVIFTGNKTTEIDGHLWAKQQKADLQWLDNVLGSSSKLAKGLKAVPYVSIAIDAGVGVRENIENKSDTQEVLTDVVVDLGFGIAGNALGSAASGAIIGTKLGTAYPVVGNIVGAFVGAIVGILFYVITETQYYDRSLKDMADDAIDWAIDGIEAW